MTSPTLRATQALVLVTILLLAGCARPFGAPSGDGNTTSYADLGFTGDPTGRDDIAWPELSGTLRILDHGAFAAFDVAAAQFTNLTGVRVVHDDFGDTGSSLNVAIRESGDPSFDVFYGIDNILYLKAASSPALEPYTPVLAPRVPDHLRFFETDAWKVTPVDHGYIAVNWDRSDPRFGDPVQDLFDVRSHAAGLVTPDPRLSTPGLGFLLATIATFGEEDPVRYDWKDYWTDLFDGGVLITADWSAAYEGHFSAGYGPAYGGLGDKALVTSYTESPAYEAYYGRPVEDLAGLVLAPQATFHQIQTMAILKGTPNLAAAQAWIEFTLTDYFQELAAPYNAVYPVVETVDVATTYGGLDPQACEEPSEAPCFEPARLDTMTIGANLDRWLDGWTDLCEEHECA